MNKSLGINKSILRIWSFVRKTIPKIMILMRMRILINKRNWKGLRRRNFSRFRILKSIFIVLKSKSIRMFRIAMISTKSSLSNNINNLNLHNLLLNNPNQDKTPLSLKVPKDNKSIANK